NFPDFRAHERSFQLLQQVSGRAGRTKKQGKVLIQTYNPYHQILKQVSVNDYESMFKEQLEERYNYKYPPFYRTIKIVFKDKKLARIQEASILLDQTLKIHFKYKVSGKEPPPKGRKRNEYITHPQNKIPNYHSLVH